MLRKPRDQRHHQRGSVGGRPLAAANLGPRGQRSRRHHRAGRSRMVRE